MRRHPLFQLLVRWAVHAVGILIAAAVIPGIEYRDNGALAIVVVLLGLFNAFLKPLLVLLALPFVVLTLGFGVLFINAGLILLAAHFVDGFVVDGFLSALFAAVVVGLVGLLAGGLAGEGRVMVRTRRGPPRGRKGGADDVIDI